MKEKSRPPPGFTISPKWTDCTAGKTIPQPGRSFSESWGIPKSPEIVRQHVVLDAETYEGEIGEAMVVHYADKRVKHTVLVSLEDRFRDLKERYGGHPAARQWLEDLQKRTKDLEARIFGRLGISPDSLRSLVEGE